MGVGFTHVSVTDIPLTATFGAAMLLLLPAIEGRGAPVTGAAALLGASVMAKGLVPVVLALPFFWFARRYWRNWLRFRPLLVFGAVTLPWYVLCQLRNPEFFPTFFIQHQLGRFNSPELRHVQPWWFYLPVLLAAFFPSSALAAFAFSPAIYHDRRRQFLAAIAVWGVIFFSASRNKLAGYVLPLLPLICALAGAGLDAGRERRSRLLPLAIAASSLLLAFLPLCVPLLPSALATGFQSALAGHSADGFHSALAIAAATALAAILLFLSRDQALLAWFALACAGWLYVEVAALPEVDEQVSARSLWARLPEPRRAFCLGAVNRSWQYGLNYYSAIPLGSCPAEVATKAIVPIEHSSRPAILP